MRAWKQILTCVMLVLSGSTVAGADELAGRVVILANSSDPDSVRVAKHYAAARKIPETNIVAVAMPRTETITWAEFVTTIWEPVQSELVRRRWIDAIRMNLADGVGRTKYAVSGHRISFLVTCRGVPLRIMHDPALFQPALPYTENSFFRTNAGAVDAELSLLTRPTYPINAFIPNPLHRDDRPTQAEEKQVIRVSRLDGPTPEHAMRLVDHAIEAERTGLLGRAYVDIGGVHEDGDRWLEAVAAEVEALDFDHDVDRAPTTFATAARFDAPVVYFGWYAGSVNGPFKLPGFRFPPGAIALHIHSYSATTLQSADSNWAGPLIARGVTATVGNVFEPYLQLTHRPDLILRALIRGECFGYAAYYAQPALSWQTIAIGDPLYRPFGKTPNAVAISGASRLAGYATVAEMKRLAAAGRNGEAIKLGQTAQKEVASLVVAFAIAEKFHGAGDDGAAADALSPFSNASNYAADELGLASRAAAMLLAAGRGSAAVEVYKKILRTKSLPTDARAAWLAEAYEATVAAGDQQQGAAWKEALEKLNSAADTQKK